jgi:hypothetical protein
LPDTCPPNQSWQPELHVRHLNSITCGDQCEEMLGNSSETGGNADEETEVQIFFCNFDSVLVDVGVRTVSNSPLADGEPFPVGGCIVHHRRPPEDTALLGSTRSAGGSFEGFWPGDAWPSPGLFAFKPPFLPIQPENAQAINPGGGGGAQGQAHGVEPLRWARASRLHWQSMFMYGFSWHCHSSCTSSNWLPIRRSQLARLRNTPTTSVRFLSRFIRFSSILVLRSLRR